MEERIREQRRHLPEKVIEQRVEGLVGRIQHRIENAPVAFDRIGTRQAGQFRMGYNPAGRVAREVDLRHDADAAGLRAGNELADLVLGEVLTIRTLGLQLGVRPAFDPEALVVGEVEVQHVELHQRHAVQIALDHLDRLPVTGHVDQQTAPWEARMVTDADPREKPAFCVPRQQLRQGLQPAHCAYYGCRAQRRLARGDVQGVGLVFAE